MGKAYILFFKMTWEMENLRFRWSYVGCSRLQAESEGMGCLDALRSCYKGGVEYVACIWGYVG